MAERDLGEIFEDALYVFVAALAATILELDQSPPTGALRQSFYTTLDRYLDEMRLGLAVSYCRI